MAAQAQVKTVLASEVREDGSSTLALELDAMPGAVWQFELQSLMPADMRVSLFERGSQKCALVSFAGEDSERARAAFDRALELANEVSQQAHLAAANDRKARELAGASR